MGIFDFLHKREQTIDVYPVGKLKYLELESGNSFSTYLKNDQIKQNYELIINSEFFTDPKIQIEYYNEIINNWELIINDIKAKLQKAKKTNTDKISLDIFGIYEKGKEPYDATLICSQENLNFTVNLRHLEVKDIEFIE